MSSTRAMLEAGNLTVKLTSAAHDALKAGMTKEEVIAELNRLAELLENSDDE